MGTGIKGTPNEYDFGYEFDYAVWPKNTQIDLVNVPWDNNYRDVVRFGTPQNPQSLDSYIDSLNPAGIRLTKVSYVKPSEPIRVNIPHNRAINYNYLRAKNPIQPIPGDDSYKAYYYFILDVRYIAPNTTELVLQLDVWQTYIYNVTLGRSYVERGHIGIANSNQMSRYGRDYLAVPEGLDIGSEYKHITQKIINYQYSPAVLDVIAVSTTDLKASSFGTVANPVLTSAPGSIINGIPSGASIYVWENKQHFINFMEYLKDKPWVSQGIISITLVPSINRFNPDWVYDGGGSDRNPGTVPSTTPIKIRHDLYEDWRTDVLKYIPERYRHLLKFLTFPYMAIQFTYSNGSPIIVKPEAWSNADATVTEMGSFIPPNQRVAVFPESYNADGGGYGTVGADRLDMAVWLSNFPSVPIVNDGAISWLASNSNQVGWQRGNAEWTQNRALGMAQGSYDVATGGMNASRDLSDISLAADRAQQANQNRTQAAQAIVGMVGSAAGGGAAGAVFGPPGIIGGALAGTVQAGANGLNAAIGIASNDEALAIRQSAGRASNDTNVSQQGLVRDTNKNLADWAAKGDYAQAIAGINAKVQDAALIQPSTSGQFGGDAFNLTNYEMTFFAKWKMIDDANIRVIGDYWLRYGYAIRANIVPPESMMVMSRFTYWKMVETYLSASTVPEGFKQAIRGIFEKGVTVWAYPADIGVLDWADNAPLSGVSY